MKKRAAFRSEHGQTMTEFALVLPLLILVLFGIIQFGIAFNNYLAMTDAVRAGARKATVSRHKEDPVDETVIAVRAAASDLKVSDLAIEVESSWEPGDQVRVTASYPYSIRLLGFLVKKGRMSTETIERVE
jgi:Flp pilus assembly protein TadG